MTQHTPGPWTELDMGDHDWSLDTGSGNTMCLVGPEGGEPVAIVAVTSSFELDDLLDAAIAKAEVQP